MSSPSDTESILVLDSPSPSTTRSPLPGSLLQTLGPGAECFGCPICHEPIGQKDATIEHPDCRHRFDDECMRSWLESSHKPTCPVCRVPLLELEADENSPQGSQEEEPDDALEEQGVERRRDDDLMLPNFGYEEIRELEPHFRAAYVREMYHGAPAITEWHLVGSERQLLVHAQRFFPREEPTELRETIKQEIKLSRDVLHSDGPTSAVDIIHSASLVRQRNTYRLNSEETQYMWIATRVFGIAHWFKVLLSSPIRSIAFWLPMHEAIRPLRSEGELLRKLGLRTYHRLYHKGLSSDLVQLPLSTRLIVKHLGWLDREFQWQAQQSLRLLQRIAQEKKVTHWALVAVPWSAVRSPPVFAVPWPRASLGAGHITLTYPGWVARRPDVHARQGWTGQLARSCLGMFLEKRKVALDEFVKAEHDKERERHPKRSAISQSDLGVDHGEQGSSAKPGRYGNYVQSLGRPGGAKARQLYANHGWYRSVVEGD